MNYLDYLELEEARKSSQQAHDAAKKAQNTALFAIIISATLALFAVILQLYQIFI